MGHGVGGGAARRRSARGVWLRGECYLACLGLEETWKLPVPELKLPLRES